MNSNGGGVFVGDGKTGTVRYVPPQQKRLAVLGNLKPMKTSPKSRKHR
jgi:hypothetical protein